MGRGSPGGPIADGEHGDARSDDGVATERPIDGASDRHPFGVCSHCDEPFEAGVRYPVSTAWDGDTLRLHSFCDATCQRNWRRSRE